MENKTIDIRYLGILPDVLFFDEQAPAYLVMTEESDRLLLSRVVHLDAVEKAFHELSGAFFGSGGDFYLYRRRFIGLYGDVVCVRDKSLNERILPNYLTTRNPWMVSTRNAKRTHRFIRWCVDPDARTRLASQGYGSIEELESDMKQSSDGLYLGFEVLAGTTWHIRM
tara:strand:+ start:154 stop:657 length:504 start_codon:yes stop_codon:yes gene_type:complete